jgi:hypothetical protein
MKLLLIIAILYLVREALLHVLHEWHLVMMLVASSKWFQVSNVLEDVAIVVVDDYVVDGGL